MPKHVTGCYEASHLKTNLNEPLFPERLTDLAWTSEALSTLRHHSCLLRRGMGVGMRRVENGEAFSTRHVQATSLHGFGPCGGLRRRK